MQPQKQTSNFVVTNGSDFQYSEHRKITAAERARNSVSRHDSTAFVACVTNDCGECDRCTAEETCGIMTLGPDDSIKPCILKPNHVGQFCDSGVR